MAWINITKTWDYPVGELQTARYRPGRYNVRAEIAEAAKKAGVLDECDDRHVVLGREIAEIGKYLHGKDDGR